MTAQQYGRLLLLAPVIPAKRGNGLAMRTSFVLDAYSRYFDIHFAVFPIIAAQEAVTDFVRARVAAWRFSPALPSMRIFRWWHGDSVSSAPLSQEATPNNLAIIQ